MRTSAFFLLVNLCAFSRLLPQSPATQGEELVKLLERQGIADAKVLAAIGKVPREVFVERSYLDRAYENRALPIGDGYKGWPEYTPFDAIMVTASAEKIPQPLLDQLAEGGRLIMPVGSATYSQELTLVTRKHGRLQTSVLAEVVFVRMIGEAEGKSRSDTSSMRSYPERDGER
ncbi:MAG: hypothetical protein ABSC55_09440 [Syntrophorhabdales bacterium]